MAYIDDEIDFHDSGINEIIQSDGVVTPNLEYVTFGDDLYSAITTISNIETMTRDDVAIEKFDMETEHGEILRLYVEGDRITLVVIWHRFAPHSEHLNVYHLSGKRIGLKVDRLATSEP